MNFKTSPTVKKTPITPVPMTRAARLFLEALESRIAPAGLAGINYDANLTLGTPLLVKAGHGLEINGQYILAVTSGQALVYTTDINGDNHFDPNDITGIAAGDGLKMTSFVNINGDIVTNLQANGTLSNSNGSNPSGHDGLLLLNSKIAAITLRSVTAADVTASDLAAAQKQNPNATAASIYTNFLAPSTYSINGNIYAGGGIGDGIVGDGIVIDTIGTNTQVTKFNGLISTYYQVAGINPYIGAIKTGSAAGGNTFSFGYITGTGASAGQLIEGGTLKAYTPGIGVAGGDINGLSVGNGASTDTSFTPSNPVAFTINGIVAGHGGIGAKGGSISNITLDGDSGGLRIQAGDGGDGSSVVGAAAGNGGSIINLSDLGSVEGIVQVKAGSGGEGFIGPGGNAGTVALGTFNMNGDIHVEDGNGGNALGNAGAGGSLTSGTFVPTAAGGLASAVSLVTTYRAAGDIGTPKLIDFNGDGYADEIFLTHSPDQLGIAFGGPNGISDTSPVLYLAVPGLTSLDNGSSAITVGDFNGDGLPDIAVASSVENSTTGISVFLNPGNNSAGNNIWGLDASSTTGGNFIDSSIHVALPNLFKQGFLASGGAITNLTTGDFNGDGNLDLAYTTQVFQNNGPIKPYTTAVVLDGTGDGHFFANFAYDSNLKQDTKMPVLGGGTAYQGHGSFVLQATAAQQGNAASEVLVLSGNGDFNGNKIVSLIQYTHPLGTQYQSGSVTTQSILTPTFVTGKIDKGVLIGFNNPTKAVPLDFTITTLTDGPGSIFDVMVLDQGNNLSFLTGAYINGQATMSQSQGVSLTGEFTLLGNSNVDFKGITSGSFGGNDPSQFALYSSGTGGTANAFYQFDLAAPGNLYTSTPAPSFNANLSELGIVNGLGPGAAHYDGAIVAFAVYNNDANATATATSYGDLVSAATNFGYVSAMPTSDAGGAGKADYTQLIQGFGQFTEPGGLPQDVVINQGLNHYKMDLVAGSGGTSDLGAGGAGGTIGTGILTTTTASMTVTLPTALADQPFVTLEGGNGGIGLTSGGNGGTLSGLKLGYAAGTTDLGGGFSLFAGSAGSGFFGKGGTGGSLSNFQVQSGYFFFAGNGGSGTQGGNGGTITGTSGTSGYSTYNGDIELVSGTGGDGITSGGIGGNISGFSPQFPPLFGGVTGGFLIYSAGGGGNAVAGVGGVGGSILNSSPINAENHLGGPIIIQAGTGGSGLTGGAGGSVTNFTNQSTASTAITVISILAGNGGVGIVGNGGLGGSLNSITASANGFDANIGYQYNRLIAGDGGASYGAAGGVGGNLNSVNSTAASSTEALVAGSGGDGLTRGGLGGSVLNSTGNSGDSSNPGTAKLMVFAGAGGNAYGALLTAPNVANTGDTSSVIVALRAFGSANGIGGNGGSITNFTQPSSTTTAVDLIAGNGGSLMNYGASFTPAPSNTGTGGSLTNITLAGTAGRIDPTVAIQAYATGFVQNTLRDSPGTQLTDALGNVGVVAGASGYLKGGIPAIDAVAKTGSVKTFSAASIMSMVAGSVDRIAAINTVSGVSTLGVLGAYKTNPVGVLSTSANPPDKYNHDSGNALYLISADGSPTDPNNQTPTPVAGGALMDGAIYMINNPGGLNGTRVAQG